MRRQYHAILAPFTRAYSNWSNSGQNEIDSFHQFFRDVRTVEVTSTSRKCMVLFVIYRCGPMEKFTDVLKFTVKTLPEECMLKTGSSLESLISRQRKYIPVDSTSESLAHSLK